jgi:hypothetical protein
MSLQVFSLFQSGKNGVKEEVELARRIVLNVKACRIGFLNRFYNEIMTNEDKELLREFISPKSVLIPLPKSAPLVDGAQWPPREICRFFMSKGYGDSVFPLLHRVKKVPKAAFQVNAEERPTVQQHFESIKIVAGQFFPAGISEIILVDDVVTQGRTGYACFQRISNEFPDLPIKLFSLVRTTTFHEITKCVLPRLTEIRYNAGSGKTIHFDY